MFSIKFISVIDRGEIELALSLSMYQSFRLLIALEGEKHSHHSSDPKHQRENRERTRKHNSPGCFPRRPPHCTTELALFPICTMLRWKWITWIIHLMVKTPGLDVTLIRWIVLGKVTHFCSNRLSCTQSVKRYKSLKNKRCMFTYDSPITLTI